MAHESEPAIVRELGDGWTLRRWSWPDAPLELHGLGVAIELHADRAELGVDYIDYSYWSGHRIETKCVNVPRAHLEALLKGVP